MACPHCTKPRSPADHRRLFGLIGKAYENWPEEHRFLPDSAEHLRAWLLCTAGYRDTVTIPIGDNPAVMRAAMLAVDAALKGSKPYAFVKPHGAALAVHRPRSINWETLDQKAFGPIREKIEEIIEAETGTPADAFLKEVEHA